MQQLRQWHDRHRPASAFNDLLKKLNSARVPWNPPGNWKISTMLWAARVPEPDPRPTLCHCEPVLAKPARKRFLRVIPETTISRYTEGGLWLEEFWTRGICFIKSGLLSSAPAQWTLNFLWMHHRGHLCTAIVLQISSTTYLRLAGAAALCRPSFLLTGALRGMAETESIPQLHPERLEQVFDQQIWFY